MVSERKGVSFIGAMTLMITLIGFQDFYMCNVSMRQLTMTFLYIMIALATDSHKGVLRLVERLWSISRNGDSQDEKYYLIKSFLEINVTKWDKYWKLYDKIVNGEKHSAFKMYVAKIPNGSISLKQFLWILSYILYCVFVPDPFMSEQLNFLIDFASLGFFLFTGSKVLGLGDFMSNIFEAVKIGGNEKKIRQSLQLIESQIIYGSRHFGYLKSRIKLTKGDNNGKN